MREIFVSELVKDILGPRKGIHEKMIQYPRSEYMTGILQPVGSNEKIPEDEEGVITTPVSSAAEGEGGAEQTEELFTMFSPYFALTGIVAVTLIPISLVN